MSTFNNAMQEGASKDGAKMKKKKKKPRRGMGVAQLERLRMEEERWKKMTEMSSLDNHHFHRQHCYSSHLALVKPIFSVPVLHGATNYGVLGLGGVGYGMIQTAGNGCGSGHHNPDFTASLSFVETSNELSSIPKIQPQWALASELFDICPKNEGYNGIDIHGFNQQNYMNFNGGLSAFGAGPATSDFYASHNDGPSQYVEVKTTHRNGNSRDRNVLMEYEFFPDGKSTSSKEMMELASTEASASEVGDEAPASEVGDEAPASEVGDEAPCLTSTVYGVKASSNSVDLSLKLSY